MNKKLVSTIIIMLCAFCAYSDIAMNNMEVIKHDGKIIYYINRRNYNEPQVLERIKELIDQKKIDKNSKFNLFFYTDVNTSEIYHCLEFLKKTDLSEIRLVIANGIDKDSKSFVINLDLKKIKTGSADIKQFLNNYNPY